MIGRYFLVAAAAVVLLIVGINVYFYLQYSSPQFFVTFGNENKFITITTTTGSSSTINVQRGCTDDSDCAWVITNCCSENAGGYWDCINNKTSLISCSGTILCAQVPSNPHSSSCSCVQGSCKSQ